MDKDLIRSRFSKAVNSYHESAVIQRRIAEKMLRLIRENIGKELHVLLEIGCGTGVFSHLLLENIHSQKMILNDICPEMRMKIAGILNENNSFLCGDAETIVFPSPIDLVTSCSTIQWFGNVDAFFDKCSRSLKKEGFIAFATFGKENMKEVNTLTRITLKYHSKSELEEKLIVSGFEIIHSEEEIIEVPFKTPLSVLHHLRQTGVTGIQKFSWTKQKLQQYNDDYNRRYRNGGYVSLTYNPIFIIAKKK